MKYGKGDEVQSISDPSRIGAIVDIGPEHAGVQYYRVNYGNTGRPMVPESDLRSFNPTLTPIQNFEQGNFAGYQEFQRLITYQRLKKDNPLRNNIYAFNASRTRFFPYQFKPLLKFLDSPRHRLIISDEVGLGKTIEAGLIMTELGARQSVHRILVVCPSNLTQKWYIEMRHRFGEEFSILDTQSFIDFLKNFEESPDKTNLRGIISLETMRRNRVLESLESVGPDFDLIIVDEAHHMRNFGRKQRTAGVLLSELADSMIFLTATPVHLGSNDLFSLLNILDDEEFPNQSSFAERLNSNSPIVTAQNCLGKIPPNIDKAIELIKKASHSEWINQNPLYLDVLQKMKKFKIQREANSEETRLLLSIQRDIAELNLIGHIFTRTRKKEVQKNFPVRRAFSLSLEFTDLERRFYNAVTSYVRDQYQRFSDQPGIGNLILQMPQRRMASCIPAMVNYYSERLGKSTSYDDPDELDSFEFVLNEENELNNAPMKPLLLKKNEPENSEVLLHRIINTWPQDAHDSKYIEFISKLRILRKEEGKCKIIVFAFFKDTLRYLSKRLKEDNFENILIYGDVNPKDRVKMIDEFKVNDSIEILLSSRVGSEGLDFQFCNTLFNYDLPWNPMEVEQRIGRLDRIGQESDVIHIFNFTIRDTIEERIINRLYERIHIFEESVGDLDAILGEEINQLSQELLSKKLSTAEEEERIESAARSIEARMHDLQKLEKESARFVGVDQYFEDEVQRIQDKRRYVTDKQLYRFLSDFIKNICPQTRLSYDFSVNAGTINPDNKFRDFITQTDKISELVQFCGFSPKGLPFTFDSEKAFERQELEFINPLHPLIQVIVNHYSESQEKLSNTYHVIMKSDYIKPGFYFFFIFRLKIIAARGNHTLEMVVLDETLCEVFDSEDAEKILGELVESGEEPSGMMIEVEPTVLKEAYDAAIAAFLTRVDLIRKETQQNNNLFVDRRLASLNSYYGKILYREQALLQRGISENKDERYLRLRRGKIAKNEANLKTKSHAIEKQREVIVEYDEIAAGIMEVD